MVIIVGKTNYFYDTRAEEDVCKAHVLHILPHPEREDDRLIVYRWYGKHRQRWWHGEKRSDEIQPIPSMPYPSQTARSRLTFELSRQLSE